MADETLRRLPTALAFGMAIAASACAQETRIGGTPSDYPANPANPPIEGVLTDEGVECPAMRGPDGTLYTLIGDLRGFASGDNICIVPNYVEVSHCMQGTTVAVGWIGPAPCPAN